MKRVVSLKDRTVILDVQRNCTRWAWWVQEYSLNGENLCRGMEFGSESADAAIEAYCAAAPTVGAYLMNEKAKAAGA